MIAALALLLVLQGCATPPAKAPGPASRSAPQAVSVPRDPEALSTERQWLQQWFKDTPVQIVQHSDAVSVDVPREFAFDTARSQVKPPLAAVLDKLAQSLRRVPQARLELVAAPGDGSAASALAVTRATQVRKHLLSRGVPESQLGSPSATTVAAVQLRMELAAP